MYERVYSISRLKRKKAWKYFDRKVEIPSTYICLKQKTINQKSHIFQCTQNQEKSSKEKPHLLKYSQQNVEVQLNHVICSLFEKHCLLRCIAPCRYSYEQFTRIKVSVALTTREKVYFFEQYRRRYR